MRIRRRTNSPNRPISGANTPQRARLSLRSGTKATEISLRLAARADALEVVRDGTEQSFRVLAFTVPLSSDEESTPNEPHKHRKPRTASEWVQQNTGKLKRFAGRWIAVTPKGVAASADTFEEVFSEAKQRGANNPLVFRVPPLNAGPKIVSARLR
jgi:hypothetical protein